ncbi:hypothetical protein ANN_10414 [Periplaneta americana]|uniref:Uncharacterized protein n=1 Tax=Periplaneta americana TaxID=6978 RepID=A0ABQ8TRC1_PERAM|nr:hypothetical protein ANN_10414 [Periplaneta americana]
MAGLCEGGNEPPGSLKAIKVVGYTAKNKKDILYPNIPLPFGPYLKSLMLAGKEFQSRGRAILKEEEYEEVRWDGIVSIVSWRERVFRLWCEESYVKRDDRYEGIEEFKISKRRRNPFRRKKSEEGQPSMEEDAGTSEDAVWGAEAQTERTTSEGRLRRASENSTRRSDCGSTGKVSDQFIRMPHAVGSPECARGSATVWRNCALPTDGVEEGDEQLLRGASYSSERLCPDEDKMALYKQARRIKEIFLEKNKDWLDSSVRKMPKKKATQFDKRSWTCFGHRMLVLQYTTAVTTLTM